MKKKGVLVFTGIFCLLFQVYAQKGKVLGSDTVSIGKFLISGESVFAKKITFDEKIHHFQIDTLNEQITMQLRDFNRFGNPKNRGHLIRYDIEGNKVLWSNKASYQYESIRQYGNLLMDTYGGWTYGINNETGEQEWQNKKNLFFAAPEYNIAMGYEFHPTEGPENMFYGVSTKNGRTQWQREINREYGWRDVLYLDDTTILIVAEGLHSLDIRTGKGWDYHLVSGKENYTRAAVTSGLGMAVGLLTGVYFASANPDIISNISSNVIVDSSSLFFASTEELVKLNKNGNVRWKVSLPIEWTSKSAIFKSGNNIVLINRGYAYIGMRQVQHGNPFIASFDAESGKQNFLTSVSRGEKNVIQSWKILNNNILLLIDKRIEVRDKHTGAVRKIKEIAEIVNPSHFINGKNFLYQDSVWSARNSSDTSHFVYTNNGKILELNSKLELVNEFSEKYFYQAYMDFRQLQLFINQKQCIVLSENERISAKFEIAEQVHQWDEKLFFINANNLFIVDIDQLKID